MPDIALLERDLVAKRDEGLALLKATTTLAETENRLMTDDERRKIQAITDDGLAIKARIARVKGDEQMMADLDRLITLASPPPPTLPGSNGHGKRALSWGEQWIASEAGTFHKNAGHRTAAQWRSPSLELNWPTGYGGAPDIRAVLSTDPASGGALIIPQYMPGILPILEAPLLIADLFAQGTTTSNLIVYMIEKTWVNNAAPVAEGAVKPESVLTFDSVQDAVRKIAHWLPVTEEMLEDEPQIRSYIDNRLRIGVLTEEQDQLLNGTGVAPEILGLLNRPGLGAPYARVDPQTNADAMFSQAMALYASSFLMPDAFVMHPANWTATLLTKTTTGEYFTAGPFSPIQRPTLWGLPVVVTPAVAAGTGLVGAFKTAAQIFRKGGIRVESSNSHADYFIKNIVAIRAEERLALAVYRPQAFGEVTGLEPATAP